MNSKNRSDQFAFDFSTPVTTEIKEDSNCISFKLSSIYDFYRTKSISRDVLNYEKPDNWKPTDLKADPEVKTFQIERISPHPVEYRLDTGNGNHITIMEHQDSFKQYEEFLSKIGHCIQRPKPIKIDGFVSEVDLRTDNNRIVEMTYNLAFIDMQTIITELFDYSQDTWNINMNYLRNPNKKGSSTTGYMWKPWWTISIPINNTFFVPFEQIKKMVRYIARNAQPINKQIARKILDRKVLDRLEDEIRQ